MLPLTMGNETKQRLPLSSLIAAQLRVRAQHTGRWPRCREPNGTAEPLLRLAELCDADATSRESDTDAVML